MTLNEFKDHFFIVTSNTKTRCAVPLKQ